MTHPNAILANDLFEIALFDKELRDSFTENAAQVFRSAGMHIDKNTEQDFNKMVNGATKEAWKAADDFHETTISANLSTSVSTSAILSRKSFKKLGCAACKAACWSIATVIAGLGAVAISALTTSSAIVVSLHSFVNTYISCTLLACLHFIQSIATTGTATAASFAIQICKWVGACP